MNSELIYVHIERISHLNTNDSKEENLERGA